MHAVSQRHDTGVSRGWEEKVGIAYIIVSAVPLLLLCYVWYLDRLEREPIGLVAAVFFASALLGTFAAALLEELGEAFLAETPFMSIPIVGEILFYFVVVALVEEFCKRFPVMLVVWRNPAFDYRFDMIVYCVASAIGFAVAENLLYVAAFGGDIAIGRLIPVHSICGLFMGFYLGCAKICERGGNMAQRKKYLRMSLLIPVLIHGAWDFCVGSDFVLLELGAMVGILVLSVYAFIRLRTYAKFDAPLPEQRVRF